VIFHDVYTSVPSAEIERFVRSQELGRLVTVAVDGAPHIGLYPFTYEGGAFEIHLVRSDEADSLKPMTLEEAIKEAHFRDRDVFVFRDPKGKVMVLHRKRDGKLELIEAP